MSCEGRVCWGHLFLYYFLVNSTLLFQFWFFIFCYLTYFHTTSICQLVAGFTYSMLDPVISNSMSLTSWKCDTSVTLLLDNSLEGKGWDWFGMLWSTWIFGMLSVFTFMLSRKWNVYVGGSLTQEINKGNLTAEDSAHNPIDQCNQSELTVHLH